MRRIWIAAIILLLTLTGSAGHVKANTVNLIVNPDFDAVYAAQRQAAPDPTYHRADHGMLPKFVHTDARMGDGKPVMPYGWALQLSKDQAATVSWVNDGGQKAAFSAPSVDGQAAAIAAAFRRPPLARHPAIVLAPLPVGQPAGHPTRRSARGGGHRQRARGSAPLCRARR